VSTIEEKFASYSCRILYEYAVIMSKIVVNYKK